MLPGAIRALLDNRGKRGWPHLLSAPMRSGLPFPEQLTEASVEGGLDHLEPDTTLLWVGVGE